MKIIFNNLNDDIFNDNQDFDDFMLLSIQLLLKLNYVFMNLILKLKTSFY
jgi:hypothetical protein